MLGVIVIWKTRVEPFTEKQIDLVTTFADQAVIAIENVRLFKELEARNRDLTEALEQQTATSEILRVIAGSPTDTQPMFDLLAQRAGRLCDAEVAVVSRFDGNLIELGGDSRARPRSREDRPQHLSRCKSTHRPSPRAHSGARAWFISQT